MNAEEIMTLYDEGRLSRDEATRLSIEAGYGVGRVLAALKLLDQAKAEDVALVEKMIVLWDRKATTKEWMAELGSDFGHAVWLMQQTSARKATGKEDH